MHESAAPEREREDGGVNENKGKRGSLLSRSLPRGDQGGGKCASKSPLS